MIDPVPESAPDPIFAQPWHAQIFAVTVALNEADRFSWPDWAARFSETLRRHGLNRDLDGGDDYFKAWLETLEELLIEQGTTASDEVLALKQSWEEAYLTTPHGQPVHLSPE
ncbi:MAG: nitrile hydratase accessory protein [Ruegeria sp.]